MPKQTRYHVEPKDDRWKIVKEGASQASGVFEKKTQAVDRGRELAKTAKGELIVHGQDGRIQEERTYGKDPYPPKG